MNESEDILSQLLSEKPKAPWTAENWQENPGLATNAAPRMEAALAKSGLDKDFFNARKPQMAILHESPEHRRVIMLKAHGLDNNQIAEMTGFKASYIRTIIKQPWARAMLAELAEREGEQIHEKFLRKNILPSLVVLESIRDDEQAKSTDRLNAAKDLLDRAIGKPTQTIRTQQLPSVVASNAKEEADRLQRELENTRNRAARLVGYPLDKPPAGLGN